MRKLSLSIVFIAIIVIATGCKGEALSSYMQTDLGSSLQARFQENMNLADMLCSAGIIDTDTCNNIKSQIANQADNYYKYDKASKSYSEIISVDKDNGDYKSGEIVKSVCGYWVAKGTDFSNREVLMDDGKKITSAYSADDLDLRIVGNWYHKHYIMKTGNGNTIENQSYNVPLSNLRSDDNSDNTEELYIKRNDSTVIPIKIVDEGMLNEYKGTDCTVYVLKSSIGTSDGQGGLDEIIESIRNNDNYKNGRVDSSIMKKYFEVATDDSGNKITFGKLFNFDDLVCTSKGYDGANIPKTKYGEYNRPGYDMIVMQEGWQGVKIRITEFNSDEVHRVCSILGVDSVTGDSTNKWVYGTNNDIYLMEYPVHYILGMELSQENDKVDTVELNVAKSKMRLNLFTGKTLYVNGEQANVMTRGDNEYITLNGAVNVHDESKSSFILGGTCSETISVDINNEKSNSVTVQEGRIILRDYLEAIYEPEVVDGSNLVVYGRKIRFNKLYIDNNSNVVSTSSKDEIAVYVDKNGDKLGNKSLTISDFCSLSMLNSSKKIARIPYNGESVGESGRGSSLNENSSQSLEYTTTSKIGMCTMQFPSSYLGAEADEYSMNTISENGECKQLFYAIATTGDIITSGLYSSWINVDREDNSLIGWNSWLSTHGFVYRIDFNKLTTIISNNFSYEAIDNRVVQLDSKVIAKIQKEMNKKE